MQIEIQNQVGNKNRIRNLTNITRHIGSQHNISFSSARNTLDVALQIPDDKLQLGNKKTKRQFDVMSINFHWKDKASM